MKKLVATLLCLILMLSMTTLTAVAQDEKTTLLVWDTFTSDSMRNGIETINQMFMDAHPNVTIEHVSKDLDSMAQTLKPAFMSGDAPDVIYHEMGIGEMGDYVKADYLMNLKDAYTEYGWNDTLMSVSSEVPSVGDFIYGVGHEVETMGLYYNPAILEAVGVEAPKTVEELTAAMAKVKEAGYVPMGNTLDQYWYTNMNFVGTMLYAFMSKDEINACMNQDASWDLPSVRRAVQTIIDWINAGYFPDHPEVAMDQQVMFALGESAFWVTGNWAIGMVADVGVEGFTYDIIPFPGSETCADGGSQVNFVGSGFMVSNLSDKKDLALQYIDFCLNTPEAAKVWYEVSQVIPPFTGDSGAAINDYLKKVTGYLSDPSISNVAGINMWLGGNTFEFFSHAGQDLVLGVYDVDGFIQAADAATAADIAAGGTKGTFQFDN
jgi:raffinose/stachyose/melibiose transport system substrate-binding protein